MIPVETTYLRPRSSFVLLTMVPILIVLVIANTTSGDATLRIVSGCFLLIPVGIYIFQTNSYVQVDNDGIVYKTPFRQRQMQWKEVTRSYMRVRHTGKSSQRLWYFENIVGNHVRFATGLFSRKSIRTIAEALITKCPHAEIDEKIRKMAEGRFPWYIF